MSDKAQANLAEAAREAGEYAQRWGIRRAIVAFSADTFLHLTVDHAASCGYRTVAIVHPSGACNFVEAE